MNQHRRNGGAVLALGLSIALASTAGAQSLVRISGLGGRQMPSGMQPIAISADGQRLLISGGDGLFVGDNNGAADLSWFDTRTGVHQRAFPGVGGVVPDGDSAFGALSANERYVVCTSFATNLLPGDTNGVGDAYVLDQQTGVMTRATLAWNGAEPTWDAFSRGVSDNGRFVVFECEDDALVQNDANSTQDIFVRDTLTNTTQLVSMSTAGSSGSGYSDGGKISADGRYVVFNSQASDLILADTNGFTDVFLRDLQLGTTTRVSVSATGIEANGDSMDVSMSPDARWIAFASAATNLAPGANAGGGIYLVDRTNGQVVNAARSTSGQSTNGWCSNPKLSGDGRYVAFQSFATNLDPLDTDNAESDNFLRDVQLGVTRIVSIATNGSQGSAPSTGFQLTNVPMTSADGQRVLFNANLAELVAGDTNDESDAFLWDAASTCPAITSYCVGKLNSEGCVPSISSSSEPRLAGPSDSFFLSATGLVGNQIGMFLWSYQPAATPFYGGTLCLAAPVRRTAGQSAGGSPPPGCSGSYSFHFTQAYMAMLGVPAGNAVFGQFWGRDNGLPPPNNVALSDAILFTIWP